MQRYGIKKILAKTFSERPDLFSERLIDEEYPNPCQTNLLNLCNIHFAKSILFRINNI